MITGVMYWNKLTLEVKGHAGSAAYGSDIICAAVSMLTGALAGALEEAEARGRTKAEWKKKDGTVTVSADPGMGSVNEIKAYFKMCVKGMRMLQEQYKNNVVIREVF